MKRGQYSGQLELQREPSPKKASVCHLSGGVPDGLHLQSPAALAEW